MSLVEAYITGHLGLCIEELDYGGLDLVTDSIAAFKEVSKRIAEIKPDTIVLSTPHNVRYSDYLHISPGEGAGGVMKSQWLKSVSIHADYDTEFVRELIKAANAGGIPVGTDYEQTKALDHGTMIPLKFVNDQYRDYKLVRMGVAGISFEDHYRLGQIVREVSEKLGRRTVFIASGDLSHRLNAESPYGFAEEGPIFEEKVVATMANANFIDFMTYDLDFLEIVAECGLRTFIIMSGALDGMDVEHKLLAHDHSYGVGCATAWYKPVGENPDRKFLEKYAEIKEHDTLPIPAGVDAYIMYAKYAVEGFIKTGEHPRTLRFLPAEMGTTKYGVYVEIRNDSGVRAAFGLDKCTAGSTADEIFNNAITAAAGTAQYVPITADELGGLAYRVYLIESLGNSKPLHELELKSQGVLAADGVRRCFIMPDDEGNEIKLNRTLSANGLYPDSTQYYPLKVTVHK